MASKHEGREIVLEAPAPAPKVVDLMAALEASVKAASGATAPRPPAKAAKKAAPAKAAKKAAPAKTAEGGRAEAARRKAS